MLVRDTRQATDVKTDPYSDLNCPLAKSLQKKSTKVMFTRTERTNTIVSKTESSSALDLNVASGQGFELHDLSA